MKPLRLLGDLRRRVLVHRRPVAAVLAAVSVWLVTQTVVAPPPATVPVWTASRDLPSGTLIARDDLRRTGYAPGSVPAAALRSPGEVLGRTLATPLGAGEPVTAAHLVGAERLAGYPGREAVGVRVPDAEVARLLTPGQRVTLLAADPQGGVPAEQVAADAAVLAVPEPDADPVPSALGGRLVVFAIRAEEAPAVVSAATSRYLTVVWSR